jgi:hypothetical protein
MDDETRRGIEYLRGIFESGKVLRLGEPRVLGNFNYWNYFVVRAYEKQWDFAASRDDLSDLPATRRWHSSANSLARELEQRFKNVSPNLFWSVSGRALEIDVQWPREAWGNRAASCLRVRVRDKVTNESANCFVTITYQQDLFELKEDPFQLHAALANTIRAAVDAGSVTFYPSAQEHPQELQKVSLRFDARAVGNTAIDTFLKQKVLALGFRSGGRDTRVWIADPSDAQYLGVNPQSLRQEAELIEAEEFFTLSEDRLFAHSSRKLLLELRVSVSGSEREYLSVKTKAVHSDGAPTVFISYSWDSDAHRDWVIQVATRLRQDGINVVLDYWDLLPGGDKAKFMERSIVNSDFVLIVCTPGYADKANERSGGAGYEAMIITSQIAKHIEQTKFIPVLRLGNFDDSAVPIWLQTKIGIDLRGDRYCEQHYEDLVRTLHSDNIKAPPLGPRPVFLDRKYLSDKGLVDNAVSALLEPSTADVESRNEPKPVQSPPVAYVVYQTKGQEAHQVDVYVRPLDARGERFRMEPSNGESVEGTLAEVAQRYLIFDGDLRRKGYSRMRTFNGSGGQDFNLP